ncbi:uncharacterized protein LOC124655846 [Lolium rigidum]|uniref:uncharacterized protein LOC124655846 n=1 Tax=Lolium rigidum TaxID=89674 RepID=UPI001F5D5713|nr:uncharacterized protein LOC124655846 [Lolium rigidum]
MQKESKILASHPEAGHQERKRHLHPEATTPVTETTVFVWEEKMGSGLPHSPIPIAAAPPSRGALPQSVLVDNRRQSSPLAVAPASSPAGRDRRTCVLAVGRRTSVLAAGHDRRTCVLASVAPASSPAGRGRRTCVLASVEPLSWTRRGLISTPASAGSPSLSSAIVKIDGDGERDRKSGVPSLKIFIIAITCEDLEAVLMLFDVKTICCQTCCKPYYYSVLNCAILLYFYQVLC